MPTKSIERDAQKIFTLVRERGPQTETNLTRIGITPERQNACAPRVNQLLEKAGLAA